MEQSSRRFVSMLIASGLILGALAVFVMMIQPEYGNLENLKGQQMGSEALLSNEKTLVAHVNQLISQVGNDQAAMTDLALAMPSGPDISGALAQIYGIAQNDGIAVTSISVTPPRQLVMSGAISTSTILRPEGILALQLTGTGTYESLKSFLVDIENNIRIFDVTSISVTPVAPPTVGGKSATTTVDLFKYNIAASTYYELQ